MCDLKKESKYDSRTIYKVAYYFDGKYYAPYSGMLIEVGPVKVVERNILVDVPYFNHYTIDSFFYNSRAIGRTSGFATKKIAFQLIDAIPPFRRKGLVVLKMKISDDLVEGTGKNIASVKSIDRARVYAGKNIVSFVKIKK